MVMSRGKYGQPPPVTSTIRRVIAGVGGIKSGLSPAAKVVIRGQQRIMPGIPIQPKLTKIAPEHTPVTSRVVVEQPASSATFAN